MARKAHQLMKSSPSMRFLTSLALPKEAPAVRCGRAYGSDPTAAVKLFSKLNLRYPVNQIGDLDPTEFSAFVFRDPLRSAIHCYGLTAGVQSGYTADFDIYVDQAESFPIYQQPLTHFVGDQVHGDHLYYGRLGKSDPHRGILLTVTQQLTINVDPQPTYPAGTSFTAVVKLLNGNEWQPVLDIPFVASAGLPPFGYAATTTGYYAVTMTSNHLPNIGPVPVTHGDINVYIHDPALPGNSGMAWAQRALPQIDDIITTIDAIRIIGASVMYTNTASPLNRQGQITGLQVPKNVLFTQVLDQAAIAQLAKSQTIDIVNGMYGFLKPTATTDLDMRSFEFISLENADFVDTVFDIYPQSDYLALGSNVIDPNGRQGYLTFAYSVEYETFNQWAELQVTDVSSKDVDTALRALSAVPQWHTNSFHVDDIWNFIKDAAGAVWGGIKEVASVAGPLIPIAAALV